MGRSTHFRNLMVTPRTLTAATTLTDKDAGKTIFLNSTTEFAVTLPKPQNGVSFNFVVKSAPSGASYTIVTNDGSPLMYGQIFTTDINAEADSDSNIVAASTITFTDSISVVGDRIEMISDGTYWYVRGFCRTYNALTITLSESRSPSVSPSVSTSRSPSTSLSTSPSVSPSVSTSLSPSVSLSRSPSVSTSKSPSISPSISPSAS